MSDFGELEEVDLRSLWPDEEDDFTPWLSENLDYLSDILEMDLELKQTEKPVGSYKADLVAQPIQEDIGDVVVENQLGKSDHDHLGKIITYRAGLDASYVVWICEDIREEHQTAIDWLNSNLPREVGLLALEVKAYRIGDSEPAPKLEIVSSPDEWKSYVKSTPELTETKKLQKEFWEGLKEHMENRGTSLNPRKAKPHHWYDFSVGKAGVHIRLIVDTKKNKVRCELNIRKRGTEIFEALFSEKEQIEEEIESELEWKKQAESKSSRILQTEDFNLNEDDNKEIYPWLKKKVEKFYKVFSPRIQRI